MKTTVNESLDLNQMIIVYTEFGKFAGNFISVSNDTIILSNVRVCVYERTDKNYELNKIHYQTYDNESYVYFPLSKVFMFHKLKEQDMDKVVISGTVNMSPKLISQ